MGLLALRTVIYERFKKKIIGVSWHQRLHVAPPLVLVVVLIFGEECTHISCSLIPMRRTSFKALPEWPSIKSLRQDENVHMEKAETPC
jgi:hypothetical protein